MSKILLLAFGRLNWRLWILALVMTASQPALANTKLDNIRKASIGSNKTDILRLSEIEFPSTSAQMLVQKPTLSQNPPSVPRQSPQRGEPPQGAGSPYQGGKQGGLVSITEVKANPTDKGLELILQTTQARQLKVINRSSGNNFIADIANAQLQQATGDAFKFSSEKPLDGITEITVINLNANTVRITATGESALPKVELFDSGQGLIFGLATGTSTASKPQTETEGETTQPQAEKPVTETPSKQPAQQDETIELVVTGERDSYRVPNASTATRTDTPLRDIPQSIQVVPRQVLEDRKVRTITEAVETVSGVVEDFRYFNSSNSSARRIRGFQQFGALRDGFRDNNTLLPLGVVEQIEVLKGPASVLTGNIEPGGIINYVTKKPLDEPFYELGFEVGNYGQYKPSIDLSGPLTADKNVLYRFIASYQSKDSFMDFVSTEQTLIAPSLAFKIGDRTDLNLFYQYTRDVGDPFQPSGVLLSDGSFPDRDLYPSYPDFQEIDFHSHQAGYTLTHELNENWQVRNNFIFSYTDDKREQIYPASLTDDRFLNFVTLSGDITNYGYNAGVSVVGEFDTGSISHRVLAGFDFNDTDNRYFQANNLDSTLIPALDITNPDYDALTERPEVTVLGTAINYRRSYGIYLQDQIAFSDNLKLLIGGRYDWLSVDSGGISPDESQVFINSQSDGAFSPRIGLVYQPSNNVSIYTSYVRSFNQEFGLNRDNEPFDPTRGTQYEVGVKADFLDGKLSATLAAYNLTKTNILTADPDPSLAQQGFRVQVGEQRSRGIELDVTGEILPGWKIIASYAHTDATVTEDNSDPSNEGNRLQNVPLNQASLWTTYEIQKGDLRGLGFGLGLFYVGERQGDLANTFQIGDYLRTDAAIFYRRNRFNAAINIRNLFDLDYAGSVSFDNRLEVERGEPFTIVGSVGWQFYFVVERKFYRKYRLNHLQFCEMGCFLKAQI